MENNALEALRSQRLNAVVFILDYLQIQLESAIVTYISYPEVVVDEHRYSFGDRDYRNKICELIGQPVARVVYREGHSFSLILGRDVISRSLAPEAYTSPEMVVIKFNEGNPIVF